MVKRTVGFNIEWKKEQTDLRFCYACEEPIFSDMNIMIVKVTSAKRVSEKVVDKMVLCNSCKEFIN